MPCVADARHFFCDTGIKNHGVRGVTRRKDDFRINNSVKLRVLRGKILHFSFFTFHFFMGIRLTKTDRHNNMILSYEYK